MPTTADTPKCYAEVSTAGGFSTGRCTPSARTGCPTSASSAGISSTWFAATTPDFTFRENADWPNNNILVSLMHAEDLMDEPFHLLLLRHPFHAAGRRRILIKSDADIALGVDTAWLERYVERTEHPSDDAEKVTVADGRVTREFTARSPKPRHTANTSASRSSLKPQERTALKREYHRRREEFAGKPYREANVFEKAYLIHLITGHARNRASDDPRRHPRRVHRNRHATGLRIRPAALDDEASDPLTRRNAMADLSVSHVDHRLDAAAVVCAGIDRRRQPAFG